MAYRIAKPTRVHLVTEPNSKVCEVCGQSPPSHYERTTRGEHSNRHVEAGMTVCIRSNRIRLRAHTEPPAVAALYQATGLADQAGKLACGACAATYDDPYDWYFNRRWQEGGDTSYTLTNQEAI
jgi:hypothetical protein